MTYSSLLGRTGDGDETHAGHTHYLIFGLTPYLTPFFFLLNLKFAKNFKNISY
jgi:hypothetical protein